MLRLSFACLTAIGLITGCAPAAHRDYATFAGGCPAGWRYLYTDHEIDGRLIRTAEVCRRVADSAAVAAR